MAAATTDPQMKSQNAMLSIIFLEQSSIYETEHALALDHLKKSPITSLQGVENTSLYFKTSRAANLFNALFASICGKIFV